jgi:AcrR family transcriptional regulator
VVSAAIEFLDEYGLPALTMRRLAETLGVEAMSLYKHVEGRDQLLDAVVESVVDELYGDPEVYLEPKDDWQDYLRRLAFGVRRSALRHPHVFPLVATRPPAAPWIRPPLRSLRWIDSLLSGLVGSGFSEGQAVDAYKAFTSFLLGHLLLEVSQQDVPIGPEESQHLSGPHPPAVLLTDFPTVQRLADPLAENTSAQEFESSLHNLVSRLQELREQSERV